jgi:hypothetical protein
VGRPVVVDPGEHELPWFVAGDFDEWPFSQCINAFLGQSVIFELDIDVSEDFDAPLRFGLRFIEGVGVFERGFEVIASPSSPLVAARYCVWCGFIYSFCVGRV